MIDNSDILDHINNVNRDYYIVEVLYKKRNYNIYKLLKKYCDSHNTIKDYKFYKGVIEKRKSILVRGRVMLEDLQGLFSGIDIDFIVYK